jgi:hypothetical protein
VILFEISDIKKKRKLVFDFSADNLMLRRSKGIYVSVGFPFRRGETHSCHLDIFVGRTGNGNTLERSLFHEDFTWRDWSKTNYFHQFTTLYTLEVLEQKD